MCDQHRLRPACTYAQSDQSLCWWPKYSMSVKLLTECHLDFLSLNEGCTGSSESTLVKMPHCWKLHVVAQIRNLCFRYTLITKGPYPRTRCPGLSNPSIFLLAGVEQLGYRNCSSKFSRTMCCLYSLYRASTRTVARFNSQSHSECHQSSKHRDDERI